MVKKLVIAPEPNDPSPDIFEPFEIEPTPVLTPTPQYPDVPLRSGLEGNVLVKVLLHERRQGEESDSC